MILKFCFDNEIHRCTRPPTSFADLKPFLSSMFHSGLPSNPIIYYLDSNNSKIYISDEETYQCLLKSDQGNSIKLYIAQQDIISEGSEGTDGDEIIDSVIDSIAIPEGASDDDYEVMSEDPSSQNQILPEKPEEDQEVEEIVEIQVVKEVVEEEKLCKEEEAKEEQPVIERIIMETAESRVYESVKNSYEILQDQETRLMEIVRDTLVKEMPNIVTEVHRKMEEQYQQQECSQIVYTKGPAKKKSQNPNMNAFLASLRNFGLLVKKNFSEIPDATMDIIDDLVQFIEGDSNMMYAGRKYPKSVCMKAKQMKEVFPDVEEAHLAEFIKRLPARLTLDQIIDTYINRMMAEEKKQREFIKQMAC